MKDTYTYQIGDNLYINLTNRCTNRCTFCVREKETYEGYSLWLKGGEPSSEQVKEQIGDAARFREVVFCGYGEPTCRLETMLDICRFVHAQGGKTRLNTNGHGSAINGRDIASALCGLVDGVNVSLNAASAQNYDALCRPRIPNAYEETLSFARACKRAGLNAWFSVVDCIGREEVEKCRKIAQQTGIPLRVRPMID